MSDELIPSISIENLLNQRQAMLERFQQMQQFALELHTLQKSFGDYMPGFEWTHDGHREAFINTWRAQEGAKVTSADAYTKAIDAAAWDMLMRKSGNLMFMDATAKEEWQKNIKDGKFPELTYENIAATFRDLHASRKDMFHRSIIKLFQNLSWDYKTNQPFRFGKRIIVGYFHGYSRSGKDKVDDLVRAFCVLDGKPEPQYAQSFSASVGYRETTGFRETEYVSVKWFKNGNAHITFRRPDLVEQMNKILHIYYPNAIAADVQEAA